MLQQFAEKTGGRAFLNLGSKDLEKAFLEIKKQVENMYVVTYVPWDKGAPQEYHTFELTSVSDKRLKLHAPRGYFVPAGIP